MNYALIIGRKGSKGFPNKNIQNVMGRKLFEYPLLAALNSKKISRVFVSTDCPVIKKKIRKYKKVTLLNRPKHLATDGALGEEVFQNAYFQIKDIISKQKKKINLLTLLFANAPAITSKMIDCDDINLFNELIEEHENIISYYISKKPIKNEQFSDFKGAIKSLGAWGGDFIMASAKNNCSEYFISKGFNTVIPYEEMIKNPSINVNN